MTQNNIEIISNHFTGLDYLEAFQGVKTPYWAKQIAHHVCEAYGISGVCDPGYIANVVMKYYRKDCYCGFTSVSVCDYCAGLRKEGT